MMSIAVTTPEISSLTNPVNKAPADFEAALPCGFMDFLIPLHRIFTPRQQMLAVKRLEALQRSLDGDRTRHRVVWRLAPSHPRVAHASNHDRRNINVQALQNGPVSC